MLVSGRVGQEAAGLVPAGFVEGAGNHPGAGPVVHGERGVAEVVLQIGGVPERGQVVQRQNRRAPVGVLGGHAEVEVLGPVAEVPPGHDAEEPVRALVILVPRQHAA